MRRSTVSTPASVRGDLVIVQRMFWPGLSLSSMGRILALGPEVFGGTRPDSTPYERPGRATGPLLLAPMSDAQPSIPAPGRPQAAQARFDPTASHQQRPRLRPVRGFP